jgi:hypothetical protein
MLYGLGVTSFHASDHISGMYLVRNNQAIQIKDNDINTISNHYIVSSVQYHYEQQLYLVN